MKETALKIELSETQFALITKAINSGQTSVSLRLRLSVIYYAYQGCSNRKISKNLGMNRTTVIQWRSRWHTCQLKLDAYEISVTSKHDYKAKLYKKMCEIVSDAPRSGAPSHITLCQVQQIRAMACQKPAEHGLPHDKWTGGLLAKTAIEQGIIEQISGRYVNKLLKKKNSIHPHKIDYWLNPKIVDRPAFILRVGMICWLYINAIELKKENGTYVVCMDEKTGIQATSRLHEDLPVGEGKTRKQEFGYKRNGTVDLFAATEVATNLVLHSLISKTHNSKDMLEFTEQTSETIFKENKAANIVYIVDQYSTHKSEDLVRWVAALQYPDAEIELGVKGKKGILKSKQTRMEFLEKSDHRVQFFFTPCHCSWLNQIENWFGKLTRHALKNASFNSVNELVEKIQLYIQYYNKALAKPFNWRFGNKAVVEVFSS